MARLWRGPIGDLSDRNTVRSLKHRLREFSADSERIGVPVASTWQLHGKTQKSSCVCCELAESKVDTDSDIDKMAIVGVLPIR